jgi:uncharacterized protein YdaU (DUF1376 family)
MGDVLTINRTPKDFVAKTRHLSVEDRGAYQEILDQIVILGQDEEPPSIPDDEVFVANLLGWSVSKWRKTRERLCSGPFRVLEATGGRLSQTRIVEEIEAARGRIAAGATGGRASGASRRAKLRERMSTNNERPFNDRSTTVQRPFVSSSEQASNGSRTVTPTDREPVMSHESRVTREEMVPSSPSLPADGAAATDIVLEALRVIAPQMHDDEIGVSLLLRDVSPDPWWLVAALCDMATAGDGQTCRNARRLGYFRPGLDQRKADGFMKGEDAEGYATYALASLRRLRGAA